MTAPLTPQERRPGEPWKAPAIGDERLPERFWKRVSLCPETGCWLWTGRVNWAGYSKFKARGKDTSGHRESYQALVGEIPPRLEIDRLCRVRHCVNPAHMEAVTHRENLLRGTGPAAVAASASACVHGHPYNEENTYVRRRAGTVQRVCRACRRRRLQAWRRKRREASQ